MPIQWGEVNKSQYPEILQKIARIGLFFGIVLFAYIFFSGLYFIISKVCFWIKG